MPKGVSCTVCGLWCSRSRALRRHAERVHGLNAAVDNNPDDDDWLSEPMCSLELPEVSPPADILLLPPSDCVNNQSVGNQNSSGTEEQPEKTEQIYTQPAKVCTEPPEWKETGVQTTSTLPDVDRIRRQLWAERQHTVRLVLLPRKPGVDVAAGHDAIYAQDADIREQRRICDCSGCVRHAIDTAHHEIEARMPMVLGVRYVRLPGLTTTTATTKQLQHLDQLLRQHPEKTFGVCGCVVCVDHRNLLRSWLSALRHQASSKNRLPPPEAGGCRDRRRDK